MKKEQTIKTEEIKYSASWQLSRRDFLKISGSGLFIFFAPGTFGDITSQQRGRGYPADPNVYLNIGEDGRVKLFCSKIEMGQGIITSMAQMLAEELDVAIDSIDMVMGDTMLCTWDSGTTGSRSTKYFGPPLRKAGAEARAVLLQMAAKKMKLEQERLIITNGIISDKFNASNKVSYAQLLQGRHIERLITEVPIKPVSAHIISGKSMLRRDAFDKVTGKAIFTGDMRPADLLYAKVLRPPSHDSTLLSIDLTKAKTIKETIIIQENELVAVLHENPETAEKALNLIDAKWETTTPKVNNHTIFDYLKKEAPEGRVYVEQGDLQAGRSEAKNIIETEFYNHYVAHAPLEPYTVLAYVDNDEVNIWASTQAPFRVQSTAAETLNIPEEKVRVITPFVGGGFGGKKSGRQISEAVKLSKMTGRPVQLAWTRKEEFFYDAFRPAAVVQMKSGINSKGLFTFWECNILYTGSRSSEPVYNIPNFSVKTFNKSGIHPFETGAWRGPGSNTNVFAMESFTDIIAKQAGMDPLTFRRKNLSDKRMVKVLDAAVDKFQNKFKPGPSRQGFGICCTNYLNTYVATIAHVEVSKTTGKVNVKRVVCAQDMGEIINPQGARIQIEGGINMGISAALSEEIKFEGGKVLTENFDSYEITRFSDVPSVEVILINNPEIPPQGCGEPAITTIGAALANAIYDAVGARIFTLPMTPERILEALSKLS